MKRVLIRLTTIFGLMIFSISALSAQDFSSLLDAVEEIEINLKALVEEEGQARAKEFTRLRLELKALKGKRSTSTDSDVLDRLTIALDELRKQVADIQAIQQTGPAGTEDLIALTSEVILLRAEIDLLNNDQNSSTGPQLVSTNNDALAYAFDQQLSATEPAPTGLEFSGFIDVVASQQPTEADHMNYSLGQAELDLEKAISENASFAMAIAYNSDDGLFELGAVELGLNLYTNEAKTVRSLDLTVGQFDVPFGIDFHEYASVDNKLISGPTVVHFTHEGWNDVGFQVGLQSSFGNMVLFFVNGYESSASIIDHTQTLATGSTVFEEIDTSPAQAFGTRVGVTPLNHLEIGGSFATGINTASEAEMVMLGTDINWGIADFEIKGEYIHHSVNRSIAKENNKGYYVQGLYNFGKIYAVSRFGSFKPYEANWSNQFSIGAGYALIEDVELRFESLIDQNSDHNANMVQLVAGF